jgi:nickel transport protein
MIGRNCCTLAIIFLLLSPLPVFAHKLHVFAHAHGTSIHGEAYFTGRIPAQNATVMALDRAGKELGRTKTDQQGKFNLQARFRCDHRLIVDAGDGHGGECMLAAAELPEDLPSRGNSPNTPAKTPHDQPLEAKVEAVNQQIVALRKQLDRYEQRTRLRDVLGGIGYIVGIAGVAFYFLGIRRKQSNPSQ